MHRSRLRGKAVIIRTNNITTTEIEDTCAIVSAFKGGSVQSYPIFSAQVMEVFTSRGYDGLLMCDVVSVVAVLRKRDVVMEQLGYDDWRPLWWR